MANIGMDFAFAMPSKTTMLVGPMETLKEVLKRRGAPVVAEAFQTLLDQKNSGAWLAGAADVNALWRLAEDGLPIDLNSEERWLAESIGSVSFAWSGIGEYDFELRAHCKNAKDAPLIAERAQAMMKDQRKRLLATMTTLGQPVNAETKTLWDGIAVKVEDGVIHVSQHIDRSMLELGSRQLAATGVLQP